MILAPVAVAASTKNAASANDPRAGMPLPDSKKSTLKPARADVQFVRKIRNIRIVL
jgi:hypothetical protein